jgi:uncharacterized membrane protein (DUF373 family)
MKKSISAIIDFTDKMISLIILLTIFIVIFFSGFEFYKLYVHFSDIQAEDVLHAIALTIVFVKAYRMLLYYLRCHHISVKYIVEISIIAPAVELIFAAENRALEINILFAFFSIAMLVVYLIFYKQIDSLNDECLHKPE